MSQIWLKFGLMNFKDFIKSSNFLKLWYDTVRLKNILETIITKSNSNLQ